MVHSTAKPLRYVAPAARKNHYVFIGWAFRGNRDYTRKGRMPSNLQVKNLTLENAVSDLKSSIRYHWMP